MRESVVRLDVAVLEALEIRPCQVARDKSSPANSVTPRCASPFDGEGLIDREFIVKYEATDTEPEFTSVRGTAVDDALYDDIRAVGGIGPIFRVVSHGVARFVPVNPDVILVFTRKTDRVFYISHGCVAISPRT